MPKSRGARYLFLTLAFALLLAMSAFSQEFAANEPRQIVLTWQSDPTTTMTVTWRTDIEGERSIAFFSTNKDLDIDEYESKEAETYTFEETEAWLHTLELTNLVPGETYWVVLQTDDGTSDKFCFRTAPDNPSDIKFIVGSDAQHLRSQMSVIREVHRKAAEEDPDFFVYSGDFVNAELSDYEWDLFFDLWHELMITDEGRRIPIIPALGNHEVVAGYGGSIETAVFYFNRFKMPAPYTYHVINYGPELTIISLDSGHASPVDGEQVTWLEKTLQENQDSTWKLAHSHDGGWWGSGAVPTKVRCLWVPLFEKYGVDVVHSGHIHSYIKTWPITGISDLAAEIDNMIEEGLERAGENYEQGKNYAPPLQPNLLKLSRGSWEELDFDSLSAGLRELTYMLSLFVIQSGEATKERVFDQISSTKLFENFWKPVLDSESYEDNALIDEENGVYYIGVGGLGAEMGGGRDPDKYWWLKESGSDHHYWRITIDSSKNQLTVIPVFYYPDEGRWEEGESFTRTK